MLRKIIKIDDEKCTGCGLCAEACAEGAIQIIDGKAKLVKESYCDGLGACLPSCPAEAISLETREAEAFADPREPARNQETPEIIPLACPGSGLRKIRHGESDGPASPVPSRLSQWPIQLRLIPPTASVFDGCDLLVASDCSAFACGDFHERFIKGRVVVIGCPKLDPFDSGRLMDIIALHDLKSITVARMDVPCCAQLANITLKAMKDVGKDVPIRIQVVHGDGRVTE